MRKLVTAIALLAVSGVLAASAPSADAAKSQCSPHQVCVWEGFNFTGEFSWWAESDKGCHSHTGNPKLHTVWNNTGTKTRFGDWSTLTPGTWGEIFGNPLTGEICWPVS